MLDEIRINVKFNFYTSFGTLNGFMKANKEFGYHSIGTYRTLLKIWDRAFGKNIYRIEVVNYFRRKISILDLWKGLKYGSGSKMKLARYVNI